MLHSCGSHVRGAQPLPCSPTAGPHARCSPRAARHRCASRARSCPSTADSVDVIIRRQVVAEV
eukprot:4913777-Alexandrium_andersonii.AAC.1